MHCGAFIGHILSQLVRGGLRVEGDRIEQFVNGGWEDCEDMSEDESRDLGENIRKSDLELLTGRQENLPKSVADGKLTSDFLQGLEDITGGIEGLAKAVATEDDKVIAVEIIVERPARAPCAGVVAGGMEGRGILARA